MCYLHKPILVEEIVKLMQIDSINKSKTIVDCTLGLGGHSKKFLEINNKIKIIAIDQDIDAIKIAKQNLKSFTNINYFHSNYSNISNILKPEEKVDGFLMDLGVSSMHFDNPDRGFSYKKEGMLDMRLNQNDSNSITAYEIVNNFSKEQIVEILKKYGEEPFANLIACKICEYRLSNEIKTTLELDSIIKNAIPKKFLFKQKYPSKKTFQALRIYINDELNVLSKTLNILVNHLKINGIIAIITFHSLEDKIVKNFFKEITKSVEPFGIFTKENQKILSNFEILTKKPIVPSINEIKENPRARSAKLRVIQKVR